MKFVKFTEHNEHEGEDWYCWLQLDGNQKSLKELQTWLNTFDDDGEQYELDLTPVKESDVNALVKHGGQGYMNYHNKVTGRFHLPEVKDSDQEHGLEWLNDNFYKGGIVRMFK